eukprot:319630_1
MSNSRLIQQILDDPTNAVMSAFHHWCTESVLFIIAASILPWNFVQRLFIKAGSVYEVNVSTRMRDQAMNRSAPFNPSSQHPANQSPPIITAIANMLRLNHFNPSTNHRESIEKQSSPKNTNILSSLFRKKDPIQCETSNVHAFGRLLPQHPYHSLIGLTSNAAHCILREKTISFDTSERKMTLLAHIYYGERILTDDEMNMWKLIQICQCDDFVDMNFRWNSANSTIGGELSDGKMRDPQYIKCKNCAHPFRCVLDDRKRFYHPKVDWNCALKGKSTSYRNFQPYLSLQCYMEDRQRNKERNKNNNTQKVSLAARVMWNVIKKKRKRRTLKRKFNQIENDPVDECEKVCDVWHGPPSKKRRLK